LEKLGIYNPYNGITTNQSEGFNTVLKNLQHWNEAPVDAIILSLYHLQSFYHNEIQRGFSGLGIYSLEDKYSALVRPLDEILTSPALPPDQIVEKIREKLIKTDKDSEGSNDNYEDHDKLIPVEDETSQDDSTQRARAR